MSSLQELRTALAIGAPADRDQLAGLLWRRGLPCRPIQLPPQWWAEAADLEAGLWIAADQQQPPRWWLVQQGRRRSRVLPLQEAAGPPPAPVELQLGALSLWPRLAGPPQPLGRALAHYLQLGATVRRVLPAAALRAGLWLLLPLLLLGLLRRQGPPGLLLAVAVLSLALGLVLDRQWQQLWFNRSQRQRAALGLNGMQRVLRLPLPQLQRLGGAGATALGLALQELGQELPLALGRLLAALALLLSGGVALLLWRPQVGLIALAACLLWTAATLWVLRRRAGLRSTQGQWRALAQRRSQELIEVASSLRLAGAEERALTWWLEQEGAAQGLQPQLDRWDQALGGIALAAVTACLAAVLVGVDPAAVPLGLSLVAILLGGTWQLSLELQHLERLRPSWQGSQLLLASPAEARPEAADPGVLEGALAVRDLSFRYGPEQPLVLDRVSFEAPAGSFVAVVGPSGSGKSTLLRLLLGFEVPQQGQICFDGRDAASLQHELLRPQIGTVLQQARLVGGTLLEVIAAGRPISVEQAWMAAEQAGLAEELRALPMGLQTLVPAGGSTFSGGQRQRLAIARALVGQPRLLLFDEPTSALDNHSQQTVLRSLEALAITRVLVAHRLSTVRQADQILVLDRGRLVQRGRFDALLEAPGLFAELMQRQTL